MKWSKLSMSELRALLTAFGLTPEGNKTALVDLLVARIEASQQQQNEEGAPPGDAEFTGIGTAVPPELAQWRELIRERSQHQTKAARHHVECTRVSSLIQTKAAAVCAARSAIAAKHNEELCPLLLLLGREDIMQAVLPHLVAAGLVGLCRLARVSRAFARWTRGARGAMPRLLLLGGVPCANPKHATASVQAMCMSTLRWCDGGGAIPPPLPEPVASHVAVAGPFGRVTLVGGYDISARISGSKQNRQAKQAWRWHPGGQWEKLPRLGTGRDHAMIAQLADGRTLVVGGFGNKNKPLASAEVLSADGSSWSAVAPMGTARADAAAQALPGGHVIVAGGRTDATGMGVLATAELWDPGTNTWSVLPAMAHQRFGAGGCMLPSGRFAVVGGMTGDGLQTVKHCEAFDPIRRVWEPLPGMAVERASRCVVAVAGGLVVVGGRRKYYEHLGCELFDEAGGRWFALPHRQGLPRKTSHSGALLLQRQ
jgi:hypothetical protein